MNNPTEQYLAERERIADAAWSPPWRWTASPDWGLYDADGDSVAHGSATGNLEASEENLAAIVDAVNEAPRMRAALQGVLALCDQWDREARAEFPTLSNVESDDGFEVREVIGRALATKYQGEQ